MKISHFYAAFLALFFCSSVYAHGFDEHILYSALIIYVLPFFIGAVVAKSINRYKFIWVSVLSYIGSLAVFFGSLGISFYGNGIVALAAFSVVWLLVPYAVYLRLKKNG